MAQDQLLLSDGVSRLLLSDGTSVLLLSTSTGDPNPLEPSVVCERFAASFREQHAGSFTEHLTITYRET